MELVDRTVRVITRRVGPTRVGSLLARWAQRHYAAAWANKKQEVIAEHLDRGLRMRVDPTHHIGGAIYWRGFHSRRLLRCIDQFLRPDMTVLDVGANQGEVTLYVARRLTQGSVIAFEPVEDNYQRLLCNAKLNGLTNIVAQKYCLGDRPGQAQLFGAPTSSYLHQHGWNEGVTGMFATNAEAVPSGHAEVRRPDDVLPALGAERLDVLKIDVEGAELHVLRGARASIQRFRPYIVVEINTETFQSAGYTADAVCEFFCQLDYDGFQLDRWGDGGKSVAEKLPDHCDVLWVPRQNAASTNLPKSQQDLVA